jgi:PTS system nitrogen regulatory IIA component
VALISLRDPLRLTESAVDQQPVTRLFFFVAPSPRAHLDLLGRLGRLLRRGPVRELILANAPDAAILNAVAENDAAATGIPHTESTS